MRPGLRRGAVWIAALPPPAGRRPVVVLTRDSAIGVLTNVTVAPVTSTVRGAPSEVLVGSAEGLHHESVISCDNVVTVPQRLLERELGRLGRDKLDELAAALRLALEI